MLLSQTKTLLQLLFITAVLCCVCTGAHAQARDSTLVRYNFAGGQLERAISRLRDASGVNIAYNPEEIGTQWTLGKIPMAAHSVSWWLSYLLAGTDLSFSVRSDNFILVDKISWLNGAKDGPNIIRLYTNRITDEEGVPLEGAYITLERQQQYAVSNKSGGFQLMNVSAEDNLLVTLIGFKPVRQPINTLGEKLIIMHELPQPRLDPVYVNTGYEKIRPERLTGSVSTIDHKLFTRNTDYTVMGHAMFLLGSFQNIMNIPANSNVNDAKYMVRGRATINSNPLPLIVVDNFPYDGSMDDINPADVENIVVLKDAAAANIWGALSGNGVVVITTRSGQFTTAPKVSVTSNYTLSGHPNLRYNPVMNPRDYVDMETTLFNQGAYDSYKTNSYSYMSPVVDILAQRLQNKLTSTDSAMMLDKLRNTDVRNELGKYYYRRSFNQQYAVSLSGGGVYNRYFFSAGFDRNASMLTRNNTSRYTLTANQNFSLLDRKLQLNVGLFMARNILEDNNDGFTFLLPYTKLADDKGVHLSTPLVYRQSYLQSAGSGKLLDWNYRPLDDLDNNDNVTRLTEYRLNFQLKYKIWKDLFASAGYQYSNGQQKTVNYMSQAQFYTRNLINSFSQIDAGTGVVTHNIPLGGIADITPYNYSSGNYRAMLQYSLKYKRNHEITALVGYDARLVDISSKQYRLYGYDPDSGGGKVLDNSIKYRDFTTGMSSPVPSNAFNVAYNNNYFSRYANASYTYKRKYTLTGSMRRDESNVFGANFNRKVVPLWSTGAAWILSDEAFFHVPWINMLKLRASNGYCGNVNTSISAYTTATKAAKTNKYGQVIGTIANPPNPDLGWEKVHIVNLGADFSLLNRITGSFEYFWKNGDNLIAPASIDPTSGVSSFIGNAGSMKTKGADIVLNTINVNKALSWKTTLLLSFVKDRITRYDRAATAIGTALSGVSVNPIQGYPLYSIFGFRYKGLNATGDPVGVFNGANSVDYGAMINSTDYSQLKFFGSAIPTVFGSIRNTFTWKNLALSSLVVYKGGYYFRRPGINYKLLSNYSSNGSLDFEKRWQKTGDERRTNVPAMIYPVGDYRDDFYNWSEALVEKGDHIRLQDIQLAYEMTNPGKRLPFNSIRLSVTVSNIGIIWRANHAGIDPDYVPADPQRVVQPATAIAFGMNVNF